MSAPYLLPLPTHGTPDYGYLTVAEAPGLPFEVKRVYWITRVPPAQVRGRHAHRTLEQLLVAAHGTVRLRVRVPGQAEWQCYCLSSPTEALYLPPQCWPELHFEPGAVLLCLASQPYNAADYLHEQP